MKFNRGRLFALLRIHIERAIGRMKNVIILKGVFSINMARVANQSAFICAWLTYLFSPLVPPSTDKDTDSSDIHSDLDSESCNEDIQ